MHPSQYCLPLPCEYIAVRYIYIYCSFRSVYGDHGKGPKWLGAAHGEELQYVFGYPFIPEMLTIHGIMSDEEKEVSVKFMKFWTNFAKSG